MRASGFLDAGKIEAEETVPASRKLGPKEARDLLKKADRLFVAKGKKRDSFEVKGLSAGQLRKVVEKMLGPTGNLRAPTVRVGRTLIVGFDEKMYSEVLK